MSVFQCEQTYPTPCTNLTSVAQAVMEHFRCQEFEVSGEQSVTQGWHISITKGNLFQAVLGMKSALNISIEPSDAGVHAKAGIGIFGQQAIPTAISLFFFWPVLITQIWGIVEQAKLDKEAMTVIEQALKGDLTPEPAGSSFCTECGKPIPAGSRFCPECGTAISVATI